MEYCGQCFPAVACTRVHKKSFPCLRSTDLQHPLSALWCDEQTHLKNPVFEKTQ